MSSPSPSDAALNSVLQEHRVFPPEPAFAQRAHIGSMDALAKLREHATKDPDAFWTEQATQFHWQRPFKTVREGQLPSVKWFLEGKTNLSFNCLDRHLTTARRNRAAIIWEGEPGDRRTLTYFELHREVCRLADGPEEPRRRSPATAWASTCRMMPEAAIAMLACARIGAIHSVVFGGFSAEALARSHERRGRHRAHHRRRRLAQRQGRAAQGHGRRGAPELPHREARGGRRSLERRSSHFSPAATCAGTSSGARARRLPSAEWVDAEHPLFILYTSGSTGKPKGVLHTTGGYLLWAGLTTK